MVQELYHPGSRVHIVLGQHLSVVRKSNHRKREASPVADERNASELITVAFGGGADRKHRGTRHEFEISFWHCGRWLKGMESNVGGESLPSLETFFSHYLRPADY